MKLVGAAGQQVRHPLYRADGTITSGSTAQLILGQRQACSFLMLQNLSSSPMWLEFGSPSATATMTGSSPNQSVASIAVNNAGFNYTYPPTVHLLGGGGASGVNANTSYIGLGQPNAPSPTHYARAHCVMTGSAGNMSISSIVVDDAGANYLCAPYVLILNSKRDPNGCAVPSQGSGFMLAASDGPLIFNGTACTTDAISVFCATTGAAYLCRWMD